MKRGEARRDGLGGYVYAAEAEVLWELPALEERHTHTHYLTAAKRHRAAGKHYASLNHPSPHTTHLS